MDGFGSKLKSLTPNFSVPSLKLPSLPSPSLDIDFPRLICRRITVGVLNILLFGCAAVTLIFAVSSTHPMLTTSVKYTDGGATKYRIVATGLGSHQYNAPQDEDEYDRDKHFHSPSHDCDALPGEPFEEEDECTMSYALGLAFLGLTCVISAFTGSYMLSLMSKEVEAKTKIESAGLFLWMLLYAGAVTLGVLGYDAMHTFHDEHVNTAQAARDEVTKDIAHVPLIFYLTTLGLAGLNFLMLIFHFVAELSSGTWELTTARFDAARQSLL